MPENDQTQTADKAPEAGHEAPPAEQSAETAQQPPESAQQSGQQPPAEPAKAGKKSKVRRQAQETETIAATAETVTTTVVTETEVDALPQRATLAAPYAFYDDDGKLNSWAAGQVLTDPDEIGLLVERGAIFEPDTE